MWIVFLWKLNLLRYFVIILYWCLFGVLVCVNLFINILVFFFICCNWIRVLVMYIEVLNFGDLVYEDLNFFKVLLVFFCLKLILFLNKFNKVFVILNFCNEKIVFFVFLKFFIVIEFVYLIKVVFFELFNFCW